MVSGPQVLLSSCKAWAELRTRMTPEQKQDACWLCITCHCSGPPSAAPELQVRRRQDPPMSAIRASEVVNLKRLDCWDPLKHLERSSRDSATSHGLARPSVPRLRRHIRANDRGLPRWQERQSRHQGIDGSLRFRHWCRLHVGQFGAQARAPTASVLSASNAGPWSGPSSATT